MKGKRKKYSRDFGNLSEYSYNSYIRFFKKNIFYFLIIGIFLPFYVFLCCKLIDLGYKVEKVEKTYQDLLIVYQNYQSELFNLLSPDSLKKLMAQHNIGLEVPSDWAFLEIKPDLEKSTINLKNGKAEAYSGPEKR